MDYQRYAYARGNPVKFSDPSGHRPCDDEKGCDVELGNTKQILQPQPPRPSVAGNDNNKCSGLDCLIANHGQDHSESGVENCSFGWLSAATTPNGSCGHVEVNPNAIVDPIAWEHIVAATLVGFVTVLFGAAVMIPLGMGVCTSAVGCLAGIPLVAGGAGAVVGGGVLIWAGVKFTQKYLDEIFVVKP